MKNKRFVEDTKQRTRKRYKEFKKNYEMNSIEENNDNKIGRKHKTWSTKFLFFLYFLTQESRKESMDKYFLNSKSKNVYIQIDKSFPTKKDININRGRSFWGKTKEITHSKE